MNLEIIYPHQVLTLEELQQQGDSKVVAYHHTDCRKKYIPTNGLCYTQNAAQILNEKEIPFFKTEPEIDGESYISVSQKDVSISLFYIQQSRCHNCIFDIIRR